MKILLLEHPRSVSPDRCNDIANTPLSSCLLSGYAAGMLEGKGHEVAIVEGYLDKLSYGAISDIVAAMKPDILGVHLVYHWQNDHALFNFLDTMKREGQVSSVTAYGFYATISYTNILNDHHAVDSVIIGEPERPFADLAEAASFKNYTPRTPGLAIRDGLGGIRLQKPDPIADLDSLPFPVRTKAMDRLPEVNVLGSRGCYGKCTFCSINSFYGTGNPWRGRSPENIAGEIDAIVADQGLRDFYFTDPNFFGPGQMGQDRALRIASLLKPKNIRFGIEARVNDIRDETIGALVDAGLRHILVGLESGKDESLKRMNKMTTVAQNEKALAILRKHGVEPNVGFIMFEPDSSPEDLRINLEFLKRNDLLKNLAVTANVLYHHQIVLEGTQAYHDLRKENRLAPGSSSYEGTAYFKDPEVSGLADIMRQTTNILFNRMDGIWSGKFTDPPGMRERYARVNHVLVKVFEDSLASLETGVRLDKDRIAFLVCETEKEIDKILSNLGGSDKSN
jgi:anaerobic magnesium-protoporphyrin IX monomethyl ester cyclase